jgi:heptosyltransferase-1
VSAPHKQSPKKILIVRLGAMGDVIHAIPALDLLAAAFPEVAQIGWVVEKRWSDLLKCGPRASPIHEVDTRGWRRHPVQKRHEIVSTIRELRSQNYDIVVDFQGAMKSALIAALSGAPKRYGFANPWEKPASLFYTHPVDALNRHVVDRNLELARAVIVREGGSEKEEPHWRVSELQTLDRMKLGSRFVVLNPGAGWGAKQWPPERYAEVARALGSWGYRSFINFGPAEEELARQVERESEGHAVAECLPILKLMGIMCSAALFVGGDTGPMHLAAWLRVPVIAIFGPTDPARNGPYGTRSIVFRDPASVTSHKRRKEAEAGLLNITAADVIEAARELLQVNSEGVRA